jgi:thiol-disulfide isomerase/thioredoxin
MQKFRTIGAALVLALAGCASSPAPPPPAPVAPPTPPAPPPYHALLLSGGGRPEINYRTHATSLASLREVLLRSGLPAERMTILASDGSDPAPDLALTDSGAERAAWLLTGTRLERSLRSPLMLESTTIPGASISPATKGELERSIDALKGRLGAGDTLLLYVTDHGTRGGLDPSKNAITLWGEGQSITVTELGELLDRLDPRVRVVLLMSQCYSGAFAGLAARARDAGRAAVCGYFSSPADRPAYGCYPGDSEATAVGHSHDLTLALAETRSLPAAHARVLVRDVTPDVPLKSSDALLEDVLRRAAADRAMRLEDLVDPLLAGLYDQPAYKPDRDLVDAIAGAFGLPRGSSLAELARREAELAALERDAAGSEKAWRSALADATSDTLATFLAARPDWGPKLTDPALKALDGKAARDRAVTLLAELEPHARQRRGDRLEVLWSKLTAASDLAHRLEVRRAALLRMRVVLTSAAGRAYLATLPAADRAAHEALVACEELGLPGLAGPAPTPPARPAYPSLEADAAAVASLRPGWLGIAFSDLSNEARARRSLPEGAALVTGVYPDSPAKAGGLSIGDIVVGAPDRPFAVRRDIRAFTMLSAPQRPAALDVLRGAERLTLTVVPRPLPLELPPLPPAPTAAVNGPAPAVDLRAYRGPAITSLSDGKKRLLYFWATWCGPCKAALPELAALEREKGITVVAVTDEDAATLDAFFKKHKGPFPKNVAIDELRRSFASYGVSGTPTFVLVDERGIVRSKTTGYVQGQGLGVPGFKWKKK